MVSWHSNGRITVTVKTQLRLEVVNLVDVELRPGFSTGVSGDYGSLSLGLPDPKVAITTAHGVEAGIHIHVSKEVHGTIAVIDEDDGTTELSLPITFHVARQEAGSWISLATPIPCSLDGKFLSVAADVVPHRKRLETNQFTVNGGTWVATADPFGAGSGISSLTTGVDIVDTLAGLFTSPYLHGIRSPSVVCK